MALVLVRCTVVAAVAAAAVAGCSTPESAPSPTTVSSPAITSAGVQQMPWPSPATSDFPSAVASAMEAEVRSWVDRQLLPGVTVSVVSPQGVWQAAAGVDGAGHPLDAGSGMALASITKTFTAAEAMVLAQRGQLDLDAPASAYVDLPQVGNGTTVRQLLRHRSSIVEGDSDAYAMVATDPAARWSTEQALVPVPTPSSAPGARFSYVNANYLILGLVIEKVTGVTVAEAFSRDLWEPLGLTRLAYQDQQRLPPPLA